MLVVVVGLALLAVAPGCGAEPGPRSSLAIAGLAMLAALSLLKARYEQAALVQLA